MCKNDAGRAEETMNSNQKEQADNSNSCCDNATEGMDFVELKKAIEERNEFLAMAQRIQADFENYKKRTRNAVGEACQSTTADTAALFIPVLDNIERALESSKSDTSPDVLYKGVDMIANQLKDVFRQIEVVEIEALNKEFNPNLHEAIFTAEAEPGEPQNIVIEVLQKGYTCKDKVIRHSLVKVSC